MLSVNVSNQIRDTLNKVNERFENTLRGEFVDDAVRRDIRNNGNPNFKFNISSSFIPDGNVNFELHNLRLTEESPCVLSNFYLDLETFNITLEVNIRRLKIDGDYRQSTANTLVPMSKAGKITFILDDTTFDANVGLSIDEDSFVTKNFDINFRSDKILTKVHTQNENYEKSANNIDETLLKQLSSQLKVFFQWELLYSQLTGTIVEHSASELLFDEPEDMIALSANRLSIASQLMDSLLNSMNEFFKSSNQTVLETPSLIAFVVNGQLSETIETDKGQLENLSTFERCGKMSFYESEGIQYLYGLIKLKDFKFKYTCKTKQDPGNIAVIEVKVYRSEIFVKLALSNDEKSANISVKEIQILELKDINFNIINSDHLNKYYDQLKPIIIGSLSGMVFPLLEQKLYDGYSHAIQNWKA